MSITRERLHKIQQWRETYGLGSNVVLPAEEAEELARIALASLEAEPVITVGDDGGDALAYRRLIQTFAPGTKLYTSPPELAVPDEFLSAMEEVLRISDRDHDAWHKAKAGIVSCRAAMLHGGKS